MNQDIEALIAEKKKLAEAMLGREEFYENPQKVFTNFANSLPDSQKVWQLAFIVSFLQPGFVGMILRPDQRSKKD